MPFVRADEPNKQLDFWVGDWKCEGKTRNGPGKDEWTDTSAENHIDRGFKDHVIQEHFAMDGLNGFSISVYDQNAKLWRQTWVDDNGGYIALTGGVKDGKMTLVTLPMPKRPGIFSRMVFDNVKADSFDWNWEKSTDDGKTWELAWHLHYTRKK